MLKKLWEKLNFSYKFKIHAIEANKLAKIVYNEKWTVIDVRPAAEFKTSHIVLSKNLNMIRFQKKFHNFFSKKEKVLLVCRSGRQSHAMALFLQKKDYNNIYILKDGYNNLKLKNYDFIIY